MGFLLSSIKSFDLVVGLQGIQRAKIEAETHPEYVKGILQRDKVPGLCVQGKERISRTPGTVG